MRRSSLGGRDATGAGDIGLVEAQHGGGARGNCRLGILSPGRGELRVGAVQHGHVGDVRGQAVGDGAPVVGPGELVAGGQGHVYVGGVVVGEAAAAGAGSSGHGRVCAGRQSAAMRKIGARGDIGVA